MEKKLTDDDFELLALRNTKRRYDIELSRYKQDCRKKALDWAMEKCFSGGEKYMMEQADKYYNWLISIPEK